MKRTAFDKIMSGLEEARAHARGKPGKSLRVHRRGGALSEVTAVGLSTVRADPRKVHTIETMPEDLYEEAKDSLSVYEREGDKS